nr:MAG TPA: hypothetical protein [Caudoviricetes sp.]
MSGFVLLFPNGTNPGEARRKYNLLNLLSR